VEKMYQDLNTIDDIGNIVYQNLENYIDMDRYEECKDIIFNQIMDFNNLGFDMLAELNVDDNIKINLLTEVLDFCKENYINIADTDYDLSEQTIEKIGDVIYQFIAVDCFNVLIPKLIDDLKIDSIDKFDYIITYNQSDKNFIKTKLTTNLSSILERLLSLQNIDPSIQQDTKYKKLINKFGRYLEIINFSDSENFIRNYIRPVLNKHFTELYWRSN
jgi:hypothetical protein